MNPSLESALINLGCGLILLLAWPWLRRSKKRLALRARLRAEASRERTVRSAAGIKGDGFSALFHLHRALHYRIKSVSAQLAAAALFVVGAIFSGQAWWLALPFQLGAGLLFFQAAWAAGMADGMTEVAEEAAAPQQRQGAENANASVLPEEGAEFKS